MTTQTQMTIDQFSEIAYNDAFIGGEMSDAVEVSAFAMNDGIMVTAEKWDDDASEVVTLYSRHFVGIQRAYEAYKALLTLYAD